MSEAESVTPDGEEVDPVSDDGAAVEDEYNQQEDSDVNEDAEPEPETPLEEPEAGAQTDADDGEPDGEPTAEELEERERLENEELARINSERALARRDKALDNENQRHAKRIGEIMEESAGDLIPCPVCMDGIAGWIYPPDAQQLSPEAIARVRTVIGLPDYTTFHAAAFAAECPDCGGLGEVTTGSHVPGYEVATCERCKKTGWVHTSEFIRESNGSGELEQIITGPTVYDAGDADPEIANLRQRGFTIIPPMTLPAG